jgi:single-strand DNA-binding protein
MPSLNKVLLMGNLTRDPELRVTPKGTPICQFSLAINRQFKMESGESREEVIYVDIEAWGKQGETIAKYCTKGKPLYVEGRLKLDQWDDKKTGEKRSRMKVVLEQFQFLGDTKSGGAKPDAAKDDPSKSPYEKQAEQERAGAKPAATEEDPDVPF